MAFCWIRTLLLLTGLFGEQQSIWAAEEGTSGANQEAFLKAFSDSQRLAQLLWATRSSLEDGGMRGESKEFVATFSLAVVWGVQLEIGLGLHRFRLSDRPHIRFACGLVEGLGLFSIVASQLTERHRHCLITPEEVEGMEAQFGFGPALSTGQESSSPRRSSYRTKVGRSPGVGLGAGLIFSKGAVKALGVPAPLGLPRYFAVKLLKAESALAWAMKVLENEDLKNYPSVSEIARKTRAELWSDIQKIELSDSPFYYRDLPPEHRFSSPSVFALREPPPRPQGKCSRFLALIRDGY